MVVGSPSLSATKLDEINKHERSNTWLVSGPMCSSFACTTSVNGTGGDTFSRLSRMTTIEIDRPAPDTKSINSDVLQNGGEYYFTKSCSRPTLFSPKVTVSN